MREFRQRQAFFFQQRVAGAGNHAALQAGAGQERNGAHRFGRFTADAGVGVARGHPVRDLRRAALAQGQLHIGVQAHEILDHTAQHRTRVDVRGGNDQAFFALGEFLADAVQDFRVAEHAPRNVQDGGAGLGDADDTVAAAHEDFNAEFAFKELDLFADAGLGGVQRGGRPRNIEALFGNAAQVTQLG